MPEELSDSENEALAKKNSYLVCVNEEDYSKVAVKFASQLAKNTGASLLILHVMEPMDYQTLGSVAEKMKQERALDAEALLTSLAQEVDESVAIKPALMIREGLIENEIVKVIEEDTNVHMLIVGSASEGNAKSKTLPPLAAQVGRKLYIPMLIIPGNMTEQQITALTRRLL
jgi:nucleotide-binding universal stress UspA family protein